jgi:hypothetical protein
MPKLSKDYSNAVIYTIKHKKLNFCYVGSTTDFEKRKRAHVYACQNPNNVYHNQLLYKVIRSLDGMDNFDISIHKNVVVSTPHELSLEEQKVMDELKPNLNKNKSYQTPEQKKEYAQKYMLEHKDKMRDYLKAYYTKNKEKLNLLKKTKCVCVCGGKYTKSGYCAHKKTKHHQDFVKKTSLPELLTELVCRKFNEQLLKMLVINNN